MINLHESMGPGRDRTRDLWVCSQTRICCQTRYRLSYVARFRPPLTKLSGSAHGSHWLSGGFCVGFLFCGVVFLCLFEFSTILAEEEGISCFTLIVCGFLCSVPIPFGAVGLVCGLYYVISLPYSLTLK